MYVLLKTAVKLITCLNYQKNKFFEKVLYEAFLFDFIFNVCYHYDIEYILLIESWIL